MVDLYVQADITGIDLQMSRPARSYFLYSAAPELWGLPPPSPPHMLPVPRWWCVEQASSEGGNPKPMSLWINK